MEDNLDAKNTPPCCYFLSLIYAVDISIQFFFCEKVTIIDQIGASIVLTILFVFSGMAMLLLLFTISNNTKKKLFIGSRTHTYLYEFKDQLCVHIFMFL